MTDDIERQRIARALMGKMPYGTGGDTLGSLGLLDQPQRQPSHLNAIAGLIDHYTMGLPSALAGLNPFGGGYPAAREAADRGKADARQLYGGDALSLGDAFAGIIPSRLPQAPARADELGRGLLAAGTKVDDALSAGVRMMPEGVGSMGGVPPKPQGIRAYHGSPHDFDRFDLSKIGTGEGAQAYGHGLYFAENEGVARAYRDNLTKPQSFFESSVPSEEAFSVLQAVRNFRGDDANYSIPQLREVISDLSAIDQLPKDATKLFDELVGSGHIVPPGRMYEVNIKANPADFLDWDKPLSQQSEKVRAALPPGAPMDATGSEFINRARQMLMENRPRSIADAPFVSFDQSRQDVGDVISAKLRDAGIPGVRYLDQGSRAEGKGSYNYSVFDDKLIEILRKYGLLPLGLGAGFMGNKDQGSAAP